jgi:hypothetical protein
MSLDAMKQALEAMEEIHRTGDTQLFDLCYAPKVIPALRLAIEQAEKPRTWEQFKPESLNASYEGDDLYTGEQLRAAVAAEREAIAQMVEDAPPLAEFVKNDKGGCMVCGFTPKLAAAAIRARGEKK